MRAVGTLGVAVVGLGVGRQHLLAFQQSEHCTVRRVCDFDPERMEQAQAETGAEPAHMMQDILGDSSVDIVSIASYDDAHAGQVLQALQAGKHVFVEKPLCRSLEELKEIKQAWATRRSLHLRSNLVLRAAPLYQWLRREIAQGAFGKIYAFDGDYLYGRISKITEGWRRDVKDYSVMQGGGVHMVDLMMWLTGQRPFSVSGVGNHIATDGTAFRYNDFASGVFQFQSGLVGRITANFGCVHRHQHVIRIFGTKATFIYDDQGPRLHTTRDPAGESLTIDLSPLPSTKGDLLPGFIDAIVSAKDGAADAQHEFDVMSICIAADHAVVSGRPTQVSYV